MLRSVRYRMAIPKHESKMPVSGSLLFETFRHAFNMFQTSHRIIVIHFISAYIPCQCFKQKSHRIILHQPCHVNPGNNPASKTRTYSSFVATTALRTSRSKSSRCTSSKPLLRAISKPIPVTGETVMNIWNLIGDGKLMNVQHYMDSNYINK